MQNAFCSTTKRSSFTTAMERRHTYPKYPECILSACCSHSQIARRQGVGFRQWENSAHRLGEPSGCSNRTHFLHRPQHANHNMDTSCSIWIRVRPPLRISCSSKQCAHVLPYILLGSCATLLCCYSNRMLSVIYLAILILSSMLRKFQLTTLY